MTLNEKEKATLPDDIEMSVFLSRPNNSSHLKHNQIFFFFFPNFYFDMEDGYKTFSSFDKLFELIIVKHNDGKIPQIIRVYLLC